MWVAVGCSWEDSIRFCCQSSQSTKMSIILLPSDRWPLSCPCFLLYIGTTLLSPLYTVILSVCLCLTIFPCTCILLSRLPSYFSLIPCHSFDLCPPSSHFLQLTCLFCRCLNPRSVPPSHSVIPLNTTFTPPPTLFSLLHFAIATCGTPPTLLSLHVQVPIQTVEGHLLADLTGLNVAVMLAVAAGIAAE